MCLQIGKFFKQTTLSTEVKKAEIKIFAVLLEHNIPFRVMDHLSTVLKDSFHDSEIAKQFSCKRTKSTAIAYNVLGVNFQNKLLDDLKSGLSNFSIIIDETRSTKRLQEFSQFQDFTETKHKRILKL